MKFSIISPCYNSEKTIRQTIESVLNQTYDNYEYIIIDGKSSDGTVEVIEEYRDKFGDKLKVISEKDSGIYDAMNKGIKMASGNYIGIINSDDWYEKDALQNVVNELKSSTSENTLTLYYGIMRFIENNKERRCALYNHEFLADAMINHPTVFMSRVIYEKFGLYDEQYRAVADYDYMLMLYKSKKVNFVPIYKIQANFRIGGMTNTYASLVEAMKVKKKYGILSNSKYIMTRIILFGRKTLGFIGVE